MTDLRILSLYWQANRRYPRRVAGLLVTLVFAVGVDFAVPLIVASALNRLVAERSAPLESFAAPLAAVVVLQALGMLAWRLSIGWLWRLEIAARADLAEQVFGHLARQSEQFHLDNFGGALVADATKFLAAYERLTDEAIFTWYTTVLSFVYVVVFLVWDMPLFVLALVALSVVYLAAAWRVKMRELPFSRQSSASHSRQTSQLADTITNISTVRSFGREEFEDELFEQRTRRLVDHESQLMRTSLLGDMVTDGLNRIVTVTAVALAIVAVVKWGQPVGTVLVVVTYSELLLQRLRTVQRSFKNVVRSLGDARAMAVVLGCEPTVQDPPRPLPLAVRSGAIAFEGVTFSYLARHRLFRDFDLRIQAGERVGLVGPSGSGKTTLTKLLLRFVDVQEGRILIDGHDIAAVPQGELRRQVTYVPQEPLLFHRSIRDNIAYGRMDATEAQILEAARHARADEFINRLPQGYETLVGERGTKLSGGQRQRIALARAFLKRTPVLILDEATSALDSHSEALIQQALAELMQGGTAIVIAHRLSTVSSLDRIVVLDHGRIIEDGTHAELLAGGGTYAGLWNRQSGGFLADDRRRGRAHARSESARSG
ncbi:MAG: ATP-binding cassette, subfamily bacterial [Solirubrobacteraceae bacterium]|jgi:ATP-binding cassette subfamily B protein|nr:ATP-binding cassette, subfamily bacterial [Solirubrobacteraceae bacterium]MEA2245277.1 ATP-binding cassette, subfamily bacterial [Solirubrobacteraceae bacterium]